MINEEKAKYANGDSLDSSAMSTEEKMCAINYWCEGNEQLKQLLLYCNNNNIETIGCCAGHSNSEEHDEETAYIAIRLGTKNDEWAIDLLTALEEKNMRMKVGFVRGIDKVFCVLNAMEIRK